MTTVRAATVLAEEPVTELPMPAWVFGLIAFGILVGLLLVTLQFDRDR